MASKTLAAAIERQSGACRALAISLHDHAENSPHVGPAERKILVGYADQIAEISEALTKALKEDDRIALAAIWKWAAPAATLALAVAGGAAGGAAEAWTGQKVEHAAGEVMVAFDEDAHLVESMEEPQTAAEAIIADVRARIELSSGVRVARVVTSRESDKGSRLFRERHDFMFSNTDTVFLSSAEINDLVKQLSVMDYVTEARPIFPDDTSGEQTVDGIAVYGFLPSS